MVSVRKGMRYNSRSPAESDTKIKPPVSALFCYNSRSPAESDRRCVRCGRRYGCYNSRSPAESDSAWYIPPFCVMVLQLALSCGERRYRAVNLYIVQSLQLTLSYGERPARCRQYAARHGRYNSRSLLRRATFFRLA